jgi:ATP-dependent DNA helicase RecG
MGGMATTVGELRNRLRGPLALELRSGCRDTAVKGGLERLLETVGGPFGDVRALMDGYSELEPEERAERLERALSLLGPAEVSEAPVPKANGAPKPAQKDAVSATFSSAQLDAEFDNAVLNLGQTAAKKLTPLGLKTYRDLLFYYPKRYEDRRALPSFAALGEQESVTVVGTITGRKLTQARSGMTVVRAFLEDAHGARLGVVWFNQAWLEKQLFPGQRIIVSGKVKRRGSLVEMAAAHHEIDDDSESLSAGRIVGVYGSTQGLSQAYLRRAVKRLLDALGLIPDHLPKSIVERFHLISLDEALREVHFPTGEKALAAALRRLKFDEFLFLELRVLLNRDTALVGKRFKVRQKDLTTFASSLPFKLTNAQGRVLDEILGDMANPKQMARLLQGDVGSGKTAVAAAAAYVAVKNGYQAALMAPTEILARQHYLNLIQYLHPLGVACDLFIGSAGFKERREARERLQSSQTDLAVGTHALIQDGVVFRNLGLAIVDEEHRFGVEQRRKLLGNSPDVLVMSATPIPRSLALTYYGDLELSIIDELPPGRQGIETRLVNDAKRRDVYRFAWGEIQKGRQVYLVTPLIEESEAEVMSEIVSATQMYDDLRAIMPEACRIALLHGKMTGQEKDEVMEAFRRREYDLLVSTTVIEVGVDIPNASVMIIENAERFGLSQLHQLRGRVGRGEHASYCILIAGDRSKKTQHRLGVIEKHSDGFVIAEKDLELRGPGELRGTRQSGMPDLVLGDLSQDTEIIERSRDLAKRMLEADPKLEASWAARLREELKRRSRAVAFREII